VSLTPRYYGWTQRTVPRIAFGSELWIDPRSRPDFPTWEAFARQRGEDPDSSSLGFFMTRTLLHELLFAVGGVETEFPRLCEALDAAQLWSDESRRKHPRDDDMQQAPEFREYTGAPSLLDAHFAFWNLLAWTRAVQDRVDRSFRPGSAERVGLLPALDRARDATG